MTESPAVTTTLAKCHPEPAAEGSRHSLQV